MGGALCVHDEVQAPARAASADGEERRRLATRRRRPAAARDAEFEEVWRELAELRRELRQAVGHGASKVARLEHRRPT